MTQKGGSAVTKKPRDLEPVVLEMPAGDKKLVIQIRCDRKTNCGLGKWSGQTEKADWAVHIIREHNRDFLYRHIGLGKAFKVVKKRLTQRMSSWSGVTSQCGFWDGSCESGTCGDGVMIQAFTKTLGWAPVLKKKNGPVLGRNSLDAEVGGCGMLMEILSQWIDKSMQ